MKSSEKELRKRGFPDKDDIAYAKKLTTEELYQQFNAGAAERSAAVIALRERLSIDDELYITFLLSRLTIEKFLYTKIEICNSLESGTETVAHMMCTYLGRIGNNQYQTVPDVISKKKSFPLPRDIIARSLGRMNIKVFPVLLDYAQKAEKGQLSELLDAIGYMAFYNPDLSTIANFNSILHLYNKYKNDELIIWKLALCCSGFAMQESVDLLNNMMIVSVNSTIIAEAQRSLRLMKK